MKIALFNYSDNDGGAARAAQRIHYSLINFRVNSTFYVEKKTIFENSIKLNPYIQKNFFLNFNNLLQH